MLMHSVGIRCKNRAPFECVRVFDSVAIFTHAAGLGNLSSLEYRSNAKLHLNLKVNTVVRLAKSKPCASGVIIVEMINITPLRKSHSASITHDWPWLHYRVSVEKLQHKIPSIRRALHLSLM